MGVARKIRPDIFNRSIMPQTFLFIYLLCLKDDNRQLLPLQVSQVQKKVPRSTTTEPIIHTNNRRCSFEFEISVEDT